MNTQPKQRRVYTIGKDQYVLPFIAGGFYVSDRNGRTVLEAQSYEAAKAFAQMLNEQAHKD